MTDASTRATEQSPVVVERTYRAGIEDLWGLWTTKAGFESWWGPEGFRVEVHALEPRLGGPLEYAMIADTPEMVAAMRAMGRPASQNISGWFSEFRPHARVALTHVIDFIPGETVYESLIEVDFEALGDMARMVVKLHPHRDPQWTDASAQGFASQLTKLDRRFGG